MTGADRRAAAACPGLAARDSLYTPARVAVLDLETSDEPRSPDGAGPVAPDGRVLALVRLHGHPLGLVDVHGPPGDAAGLRRALVDAAHRQLTDSATVLDLPPVPEAAPGPPRPGRPPAVSVIVATHDRPSMLRSCLDSLLRSRHRDYEIVVVDNAPSSEATLRLVRSYGPPVRYTTEPVAGLGRAHNAGLAVARGEICAFTDDDTIVDPGWLAALERAFDRGTDGSGTFDGDRIGCVTGLILPAELETDAQCALERYGGFGKGFVPRGWSLRHPPDDPLFPWNAGQFGSGANMAFRTGVLRGLGGFDPSTGTGTPARGGDDLLAFFRVVTDGQAIVYQPDALVWHRHRRTMDAVPAQAFGYGAGFGAYLTAAVRHRPDLLPGLLRRLPRGVRHAAARGRAAPAGPHAHLLGRLQTRGLLYGPLGYLRSVRRTHRTPIRT